MTFIDNRLSRAKELLESSGCTLAAVTPAGDELEFKQRGVADLLCVYRQKPELLQGAAVADKIIGVAAAALMAKCGVAAVYTPVITERALRLLFSNGIEVRYGRITPYVINRAKTGQCPLDSLLRGVEQRSDAIIEAIEKFVAA